MYWWRTSFEALIFAGHATIHMSETPPAYRPSASSTGTACRDLPAGRVAAVVGPNGAGKTTLLNLLVGLLPPSEGEAKVFDAAPDDTPSFLGRVGFVAQDAPLYRDFSAADHLRMGRHLNPIWHDDSARDWLMAAEVPLDRRASTLSGGQRAQLALALAVGKGPDLLILDEPLASLDPIARRDFRTCSREAPRVRRSDTRVLAC